MASGNPSTNVEFDPTNAVAVEDEPVERDAFNPATAEPENKDDALKAEWKQATPLGRLKLLATQFGEHYDTSVESAFTPSDTQPTIPRIEGTPDVPALGAGNPQAIAAGVNTISGAANTLTTPGAASMLNPAAVAYALPYFAKQAGKTTAEFWEKLKDPNASTQDVLESGANAGLSVLAAVAPTHIALKGAKRLTSRGAEITKDFNPVAVDQPEKTLANAAQDLAPEATLNARISAPEVQFNVERGEATPAPEPPKASLADQPVKLEARGPDGTPLDVELPAAEAAKQVVENANKEIQSIYSQAGVEAPPEVQFTIVQPDLHPMTGKPGKPYVQIETTTNEGRGEPLTEAQKAIYPTPEEALATGLPTGRYTLEQVRKAMGKEAEPVGVVPPGVVQLGELTERVGGALSDLTDTAKKVVSEVRDAPEFTPFKESVNEWYGSRQINSLAIRDLAKELQKSLPEKVSREAVTDYMQAGGDEALLAKWAKESTMESRKRGYERALQLTPEEKAVAEGMREYYADKLEQAQEWGIIDEGLPNYVNQIWKEQLMGTPPETSTFGGRLAQSFRSARKRSFENFFEGEKAGFKPATKDISELMALYSDGLNKAIATRKLVKDLTTKTASDGRPLAAPIGSASIIEEGAAATDPLFIKPRTRGEEVSDYRPIDNPALYKWKWVGDEGGKPLMLQGQLGLHPEIYAHMKDMLGRSAIREWYDKPSGPLKGVVKGTVKLVDKTGQMFKGMSLGFLSPFHQVQEGTHAIGHRINPFFDLPDLKADDPVLVRGVNHGLALAGERDAMEHFGEGLGGSMHNNPLWRLPVVGKWAQDYSTWLFHDYIPKLKLKTYEAIERRNLELYRNELAKGEVTPDQLFYLSSQQTNAAYGHLNYADIGRNPTLQHILQMTLLAPDFLEARGRFTAQAAKGLVGKNGREQLTAIGTLAATFWIASRVLNKTLDDDYHWDHPFTVVHNGREYAMRSVPEDIYRLFKDSRAFVSNRLSPLVGRGTLEFLTGRNWRGEKITYSQEARDLATRWVPINFQNNPLVKKVSGSGQGSTISQWEQFLSSSGLQIKRTSGINDAYQLASDWKDATGKPKDTGTYPVSKYQQLRYALEDEDSARVKEEVQKLLKTQPIEKIVGGFHQSLMLPFTDSTKDEVEFIKSLDEKGRAKIKTAYAERQAIWAELLNNLKAMKGQVTPPKPK